MFSLFKKKKEQSQTGFVAYISGKVVPIEEVNDGIFSAKILGDGLAIKPEGNIITAPCDGTVTTVMEDSKHAVGIAANNGLEILIHEGLDTVALEGKGFELFVKTGQKIRRGDKLIRFDDQVLKEKGMNKICIMVITNSAEYPNLKLYTGMDAVQGETVIAEI